MIASTRKYPVIYADPPWRFQNFSQKGEGRNAIAHYDCLDVETLADLPVAEYAEPDCTLLIWATDPLLPQALRIIEAWDFKYKTVGFYWAKLNKTANSACFTSDDFFCGLGYWTRANVEQCLLATRGNPRRLSRSVRKLCVAPRREHSRKPDQIYDRIEALVAGPYLELFARETRPGWDHWGDQAGLFDRGAVKTRRIPSELKQHRLPF
jgi:N6-adenosine-specific RNA methylase IME4